MLCNIKLLFKHLYEQVARNCLMFTVLFQSRKSYRIGIHIRLWSVFVRKGVGSIQTSVALGRFKALCCINIILANRTLFSLQLRTDRQSQYLISLW